MGEEHNDEVSKDDLWIAQSLGDISNWRKLDDDDRAFLRRKQGLYALMGWVLAIALVVLSVFILRAGAKAPLLTSGLAIVGAVFPAAGKLTTSPVEYFESCGEKRQAAKLRLLSSYFNAYALLLVIAAFFDFCFAAALGLWK
ncbi:hypothetical protein MCC01971_03620 [Bifidobacteriaceae bacterium MCC01971]|nr:hypothetical protein MCC01971_03620 [Bifidobacteriaceae bacterium MCC01971]